MYECSRRLTKLLLTQMSAKRRANTNHGAGATNNMMKPRHRGQPNPSVGRMRAEEWAPQIITWCRCSQRKVVINNYPILSSTISPELSPGNQQEDKGKLRLCSLPSFFDDLNNLRFFVVFLDLSNGRLERESATRLRYPSTSTSVHSG